MYLISNDHCELSINKQGFIEHYNLLTREVSAPAYFVCFKEYSRLDPSCVPWNVHAEIFDLLISCNKISYKKSIFPPTNDLSKIMIGCSIEAIERGFKWTLKLLNNYPLSHRFGVTVPFKKGNQFDIESKPIKTPVCLYNKSLEQFFPDQTLLPIPMITIAYEDYKLLLMCDIKRDFQFFCYEDSVQYIRLTTLTSSSDTLEFILKSIPHNESVKKEYLRYFPDAEFRINKWRYDAEKIVKIQGAELLWRPDAFINQYNMTEVRGEKLENPQIFETYSDILMNELKKYPTGFLSSLNISAIIFCGNIRIRNFSRETDINRGIVSSSGFIQLRPEGGLIYLDANIQKDWIIHHEIFHFIAHKLRLGELEPFYSTLIPTSIYPEEHWADLFASMMTNPNEMRQNTNMQPRINQLEIMIDSFGFQFSSERSNLINHITIFAINNKQIAHPIPFGSMPDEFAEFTTNVEWYEQYNPN